MNFIKGQIYNVNEKLNKNIFMWGDEDSCGYIQVDWKAFFTQGGGFKDTSNTAIEATEQEKRWFYTCQEVRRYIPLEEIPDENYEIY